MIFLLSLTENTENTEFNRFLRASVFSVRNFKNKTITNCNGFKLLAIKTFRQPENVTYNANKQAIRRLHFSFLHLLNPFLLKFQMNKLQQISIYF